MVANWAFGEKEDGSDSVPDADAEGMRIFMEARQHLPRSVFGAECWQRIAGPLWPKVVYTSWRSPFQPVMQNAICLRQQRNEAH